MLEQLVEAIRRHAVEQLPDMVVAGNPGQAEQGLGVGASPLFGQRALVRQERGRLHEEHRQRRQADVLHGVLPVAAPARVGQLGQARPQPVQMARQMLHDGSASTAMRAANTAKRSAGGIER